MIFPKSFGQVGLFLIQILLYHGEINVWCPVSVEP